MKLSVVVPVYNECWTIGEILRRVLAVRLPPGVDREVLVVDDGSTDGTRELLQDLQGLLGDSREEGTIRVLFQEANRGKGSALRRGFGEARGEIVLVQDADLEYDPEEYPRLLEPILTASADVVYGSRFAGPGGRQMASHWQAAGNRLLTACSNAVTGLRLTDMECCYKVFRRGVLEQVEIEEDGFGVEPELTAKVARLGCRVSEVGVSYVGRTQAEGKKLGWRDALRASWCIAKYNFLGR